MLSDLVAAGVAAAITELNVDPEVLQIPVDHHDRAVVVCAVPDLIVLKVDTDPARVAAERRMLAALAGDVLVPEVLLATDGPPAVTGLSYIGGDRLDRGEIGAWRRAGEVMRAVHGLDEHSLDEHGLDEHGLDADAWSHHRSHPDRIGEWIDEIVAAAEAIKIGSPFTASGLKEFRRIAASLIDPEAPIRVLHGDFSTEHVLVRGEQLLGVIDFGDAGVGDPAHDLAVLTLWNPERVDHVMKGYRADPTLEASMRSGLRLHRLLRLGAGALWLYEHDFDPTPLVVALYEHLLD